MSVWRRLRKKDKLKLIYAYVISPILISGNIGGAMLIELRKMHGDKIFRQPETLGTVSSLVNSMAWRLGILAYLPLILPSTVIRFVIPRRELRYGIEMYCYMLLSMFLTRLLYNLMIGEVVHTLGFLDSLVIYCILSYRTMEYSEMSRSYRYTLTFLTLGAVFIILYFSSGHFTSGEYYIFPIWEAISLCIVLNTRKNDDKTRHEVTDEPPSGTPIQEPRQELRQEPQRPPIDIASELTDIGLALIGRKTTVPNKYLTTERTNERRNVERPFLRLLADKYRNETQRKILARHFMLYKEVTLFLAYSVILKGDKELHYSVRRKLNDCLSLGITPEALKKRNDCWRRISQKFNDEYKRTASMGNALTFSFWSTLAEDNTDWVTHETITEMLANDSLHDIFRYSYKVVEREYKDLAQQSRQQSRQ